MGAGEGCTARGGARQWRPRRILRLTFRGARLARREGDPSEGRPVGRATRRKGDLYRKSTQRKATHRKRSLPTGAKITKKKVFGSTTEIAARYAPYSTPTCTSGHATPHTHASRPLRRKAAHKHASHATCPHASHRTYICMYVSMYVSIHLYPYLYICRYI